MERANKRKRGKGRPSESSNLTRNKGMFLWKGGHDSWLSMARVSVVKDDVDVVSGLCYSRNDMKLLLQKIPLKLE